MFIHSSRKFLKLGMVATSMMLAACAGSQAQSTNTTTILVMAEDGDEDSLRRDNRVVRRIQDSMNAQLNQMGFEVYDESATTYGSTNLEDRLRFKRGELVDIARHNVTRPGTDRPITMRAVAAFETFALVTDKAYTRQVRLRIAGRLIDPQSGRFMGNFEVLDPAGGIRLRPDCDSRDCLLEHIGDHGKELGEALGYELARLLDWDRGGDGEGSSTLSNLGGEEQYSLVFKNLNDREFGQVEEYLVEYFSGYIDHDVDKSTGKTHYVTYRSTIKSTNLKRNLVRVLDELGWKGRITNAGNDYSFEKLSLRKSGAQGGSNDW